MNTYRNEAQKEKKRREEKTRGGEESGDADRMKKTTEKERMPKYSVDKIHKNSEPNIEMKYGRKKGGRGNTGRREGKETDERDEE